MRCGSHSGDAAHPAYACSGLWMYGFRGAEDVATDCPPPAIAQYKNEPGTHPDVSSIGTSGWFQVIGDCLG